MIKLGKIKSWYIVPEDNNRFTYTQHNILFMDIIDGNREFSVHHDTIESDSFDATVETGSFEGMGGNL